MGKRHKETFHWRWYICMWMANKHMKRYQPSVSIKKYKLRTWWNTTPHLLEWLKKLVAMPNANKNKDKLNLIHWSVNLIHSNWWECIMVQSLWIIVRWFLKNLITHLPYNPPVALLGIDPRKMNSCSHKNLCVIQSSIICNSPKLETTKMTLNR